MKIIERWKKSLYRKAVKHRLIAPQVIVLMDGGVCSQMHQYLLGRIFENGGHKVLYDLSFYEEWGTDMDYQFVRNFDLLKAFPYLKVKSASKLALSVYKKKYFNLGNNTYGRQDDFSFLQKRLCKLNCVMLYSHSISSVGERPAPRGGTTRPDECKITTI